MNYYLPSIFRKTKELVLFLFPDHKFDDTCTQLEVNITDLFCVINKKGRVKFISAQAIKILGYEIDPKLKKSFLKSVVLSSEILSNAAQRLLNTIHRFSSYNVQDFKVF